MIYNLQRGWAKYSGFTIEFSPSWDELLRNVLAKRS